LENSFTQSALVLVLTILALAFSCGLARYPRRASLGIILGVVAGIVSMTIVSGIVAFLGYVLPFGQFDYWLASLVGGILG
jgi:lipopolysaccharide export LptBFGC system permease protein LptF